MRRTSLLILFLLGFGPGGAGGLGGPEPLPVGARQVLTEELFLAAIDDEHPASRALAGDVGAARAKRLQVSLPGDPRLEVTREAPADVARETTWGVAWTPPVDGRRRQAVEAAEAGVRAAVDQLAGRLLELRFQVREAYAGWAAGAARVSLLAEHAGRLEALRRWMRDRAVAGEESLLAAQRMEVAFESARAALAEARAVEAGWRERAAAWLLDRGGDLSAMSPELPELPEAPGDLDVSLRPDVLAARSRTREAESLLRLSRRVVEAPELLLGWKSIDNDLAGGGSDYEGPVFAVGWKLPVFDRRRADRLAAASAVDAAAAAEEWARRRARSELAAALAAYRELRQSVLAAGDTLEDRDGMALAAAASFEAGESTVTDLLDTLRAALDSRLAGLGLYATALEAHRRLELAAGRPLTLGGTS